MGTIIERKRADVTTAYRVQIIIKSKGRIVHRSSETFERRSTAESWMKRREKELNSPGGLEAAKRKVGTVGDVIKDYIREKEGGMSRTKTQVLRSIDLGHPHIRFAAKTHRGLCPRPSPWRA